MLSNEIKELAKRRREEVIKEIYDNHIVELYDGSGKVFKISDVYDGVWLEHAYDGVAWVEINSSTPEISLNQVNLFLRGQRSDGQLPYVVSSGRKGFAQIQECVPFGLICKLALEQNGEKELYEIYTRLKKWDEWLTLSHSDENSRLFTFCGFDTGHDESKRLDGFGKYTRRYYDEASVKPNDSDVLPVIMPDMNAVFYGDKKALSEMAKKLGFFDEAAEFEKSAEKLKKEIIELCYDERDDFYYDVDKNGVKRRIKSIGITTLFVSCFFDKEEGVRFFKKYFTLPKYFGTPYPYPSVAVTDAAFCKNSDGNSWNYFSQGLTMLRSLLWMDKYGLTEYLETNMEKWVTALTIGRGTPFPQELDPFTGVPSICSSYYSSTMLFYLTALKRLGI